MHPDTRLKQEEERRKREELERIVEENNKKIEEAQRKLVSFILNELMLPILHYWIDVYFYFIGGRTFGHGGAIEKNGRGSTEDAARARETDARRAIFDFGKKERSTQIIFFTK